MSSARADNWPQWRGPGGDGTSREKDLPLELEQDLGRPVAMSSAGVGQQHAGHLGRHHLPHHAGR